MTESIDFSEGSGDIFRTKPDARTYQRPETLLSGVAKIKTILQVAGKFHLYFRLIRRVLWDHADRDPKIFTAGFPASGSTSIILYRECLGSREQFS